MEILNDRCPLYVCIGHFTNNGIENSEHRTLHKRDNTFEGQARVSHQDDIAMMKACSSQVLVNFFFKLQYDDFLFQMFKEKSFKEEM